MSWEELSEVVEMLFKLHWNSFYDPELLLWHWAEWKSKKGWDGFSVAHHLRKELLSEITKFYYELKSEQLT